MTVRTRRLASAAVAVMALVASPAAPRPIPVIGHLEPAHAAVLPLAGKVVVLDPGHSLGNYSHPKNISTLVDAGGFRKPCNTLGAHTKCGYRESAFTMSVANNLKARLEAQGATVWMTRKVQSKDLVVCVDTRGKFPNTVHGDVIVSIHADYTPSRLLRDPPGLPQGHHQRHLSAVADPQHRHPSRSGFGPG